MSVHWSCAYVLHFPAIHLQELHDQRFKKNEMVEKVQGTCGYTAINSFNGKKEKEKQKCKK